MLNRAGRTWLNVEDRAWRTTRPLRRRQKAVEEEVQRIAKELWDRVDDLAFAPPCVSIPRVSHRPYAHGAFMGAAPALLANSRWRRILAFLMPDVFLDVRAAVEKGTEARALIPMFENNPVVAAFGVWRHGKGLGEGDAMEWDVFLSSALVDGWHAAAPAERSGIRPRSSTPWSSRTRPPPTPCRSRWGCASGGTCGRRARPSSAAFSSAPGSICSPGR